MTRTACGMHACMHACTASVEGQVLGGINQGVHACTLSVTVSYHPEHLYCTSLQPCLSGQP